MDDLELDGYIMIHMDICHEYITKYYRRKCYGTNLQSVKTDKDILEHMTARVIFKGESAKHPGHSSDRYECSK